MLTQISAGRGRGSRACLSPCYSAPHSREHSMGRLNHKSGRAGWKILLAAGPAAALAAVFALGVPEAGSGAPCTSDADCPADEACGGEVCESVAGGCGGAGDSGIDAQQKEGEDQALKIDCLDCDEMATISLPPPPLPPCSGPRGSSCSPEGAECRTTTDPTVGTTTCTCRVGFFGGDPKWACAVRDMDPFDN